jgi:HEAT repeat protein
MKPHHPISGRELKRIVASLLTAETFPSSLEAVGHLPARQVVNPLFALFCDADALRRWRAVTAMGRVLSHLAEKDMESARVVIRRFMWNLNEESGGIGWGCPEAMGETMARSAPLAKEYRCILISYLNPQGNFIDHPALQQGVLWGIGRLAHANPPAATEAAPFLAGFFSAEAPALRGLAAWVAGPLACSAFIPELETLAADEARFDLYQEDQLIRPSVAVIARRALELIQSRPSPR